MGRGWFSGPGIGVLDARYLRLDCTNDPLTAGLEINAATAGEPVLILQSTDDNATNPLLEIQSSAAAVLAEWQTRGGLNFAAAVGQATPGFIGIAGAPFLHTYGTQNLFQGLTIGNFTLTGIQNVAIGENCMSNLTTGSYNIAMGNQALRDLTSGIANGAIGVYALRLLTGGSYNMAFGQTAGRVITTGDGNVAVGYAALYSCTTADYNMAIGGTALQDCTTGASNTGVGYQALWKLTTGNNNVGIGRSAGRHNLSGGENVTIGNYSGYGVLGVSVYDENVVLGYWAGFDMTSASRNVLAGFKAGENLTTGSDNVFLGYHAGGAETIGADKLFIANTNTATPLIYGEFDNYRLAFGTQYAVDKYGQLTHASGQFAAAGDAQGSPDSFITRRALTTHAVNTWYALYPDGGAAPERLTIVADTAWTIDVLVVGVTQNAAQQWGYQIYGLLERDNAGNTTLAATATTALFESDANYDAQLAADNVNEALEVQVRRTGGVDYNVRWVATVRTAEVTYP